MLLRVARNLDPGNTGEHGERRGDSRRLAPQVGLEPLRKIAEQRLALRVGHGALRRRPGRGDRPDGQHRQSRTGVLGEARGDQHGVVTGLGLVRGRHHVPKLHTMRSAVSDDAKSSDSLEDIVKDSRRKRLIFRSPPPSAYLPPMPPPPAPPPSTPERLEQLVSAGLLLTSELSLEGVLQRVADLACQIIGSRYAAIGVLSDDHLKLDAFVTAGIDQETRTRIGAPPIGRGVLGTVMRDRRILRIADLQKHPDSSGFPPDHPPMQSFLGVPIERRRGVFGNPLPHREAGRAGVHRGRRAHRPCSSRRRPAPPWRTPGCTRRAPGCWRRCSSCSARASGSSRWSTTSCATRSPAVFGWAEMLVRKKDPATVPQAAFEVLDSAEQAIALINDLLDLSRLDEDRLKPVIQDGRAGRHGACGRSAGSPPRPRPAAIRVDFDSSLRVGPIRDRRAPGGADPGQPAGQRHHAMRRPGARSRCTCSAMHGRVRIEVVDEGPGMPEDDLERIFDIYQTKGGRGAAVGLGLPLSRRLARLLGRRPCGPRPAPGVGGCFILELPGGGNAEDSFIMPSMAVHVLLIHSSP